jgi:hypothetical protein
LASIDHDVPSERNHSLVCILHHLPWLQVVVFVKRS